MSSLFPLLPALLDLTGRAAVLLSGEAALAPLAGRLLDSGAGVTVFSPAPSPEMAALQPSVRISARRWRPLDLVGAALVVAGAAELRLGQARAAARNARALFHAPHDPAASDVRLGAAIAGGAIAIGVTAPGLPPEVGQALARRVEATALAGYGRFLDAAVRAGESALRRLPDPQTHSAFWRATAEAAFREGEHGEQAAARDWDAWIETRLRANDL